MATFLNRDTHRDIIPTPLKKSVDFCVLISALQQEEKVFFLFSVPSASSCTGCLTSQIDHFLIHHIRGMEVILPSDLSDIWVDKAVPWEISNSFRRAVNPDCPLLNQIDLYKTQAQFIF